MLILLTLPKSKKTTPKIEKETKKEIILNKIQGDIQGKVKVNKKYCSFDEANNFLLTFGNSRLINKDFSLFYINWSYSSYEAIKSQNKVDNEKDAFNPSFKPTINDKSSKLFSEFRRKLQNTEEETDPHSNDNRSFNLQYIELLILKKKKQENNNLKLKEMTFNKELEKCTFKPETNQDYPLKDTIHADEDSHQRVEYLYKLGIQILKNKKDKTKHEKDFEKDGKECTFKPNIESKDIDFSNKNMHYNEKLNEKFLDRLNKGRNETKLRDSVHERGDFPKDMHSYAKTKNESALKESFNKSYVNDRSSNKKPSVKNSKIANNNANEAFPSLSSNLANLDKDSSKKEEKKDGIPQLIIDVNIRPGVKKKIYVYDGDTADNLADKFSKEHELDADTNEKLKILISSHMSKLLVTIPDRADDEHSVNSEISASANIDLNNPAI